MRLFVAIDLPETIKDRVAELKDKSLSGARWSSSSQWHITLHFIGEMKLDGSIHESLKTVQSPSFSMKLKGVGTFPDKGKPRVLWAGIDSQAELKNLHESTGQALQLTGFKPEARTYKPHLTLARFKKFVPSKEMMSAYRNQHLDFETALFPVKEFLLYRSELQPEGAVYTVLERFTLSE